jgi:hypothetical protein
MRWGLVPGWWKKSLKEVPATFNARAETVAAKPMFRSAFKARRCIIPASGYYEWQDTPGGKQPWYFTSGLRTGPADRGAMGDLEEPGAAWGHGAVSHHGHHGAQRVRGAVS